MIEVIDPLEAGNSALAYYRPPADGGRRPGAHCVLTASPEQRFVYEYEALAFHESTPGHHLQIASNQTLDHSAGVPALPRRRGLRLRRGLGPVQRASRRRDGALLLRSCPGSGCSRSTRCAPAGWSSTTGMHHLGWSRERAIDFMWSHTATTRANVTNEIDRYIAWPGQALAYMIGRREIQRLRAGAEAALGSAFDRAWLPRRGARRGGRAARRAGRDRRPMGDTPNAPPAPRTNQ